MTPRLDVSSPAYIPRDPSTTVLYRVVADHLETFLASLDTDPDAHGFLRLGCDTCHHELLLAFSCKRRGFCPSWAGRRMAQTAAHLVAQVIPWVPTRQWVSSVPVPLRYWMASSQDLTAVHGFSLHANIHVPAHRRDQLERLIRYMARGAVSLERLTQDANGDLVYTFTHPWSDGTTGIRLSPMELLEKLAALVPLPRVHLVRYGGCLAPHSSLRGAIIPTPRQQGLEDEETDTASPRWSWARLLKRVFALDRARCPFCQRGALRIIAAITQDHAGRGDPQDPPASEARS
jgi:Putative transposase/Transposase zinc-binding domain